MTLSYFGQYKDLIGIPVGLMFALPPLLLYLGERKNRDMPQRDQEMNNGKTTLIVFIIIHLLAAIIVFFNKDLSVRTSFIVYGYIFIAIYLAVRRLKKLKEHPEDFYKLHIKDYRTGETYTYDMFDENGEPKSAKQLHEEMNAEQLHEEMNKDKNDYE